MSCHIPFAWTLGLTASITLPAFLLAQVCSHPTARTLAQDTSVLTLYPLSGMLGHSVSH